ncbi:MAG: hypothetical protein JOY71_08315 [Acetobacteraceae bacterium]|nr:hypothetical protein [Acetobacteraceae bacterium]
MRPVALVTTLFVTFSSGIAWADPATDDARIDAIERQIRSLQSELSRLRHDLATRNAESRAAQQEAARARQEAQEAARARQEAQEASVRPATGSRVAAPAQPGAPAAGIAPAMPAGGLPSSLAQNVPGWPGSQEPGPIGSVRAGNFQIGSTQIRLGGFIELAGIWRSRNEVADVGSNFNTGIPLPNNPRYYENEFRMSARQSRLSLLVQNQPNPATTLAAYYESDFLGAAQTANSNESNSYNLRLRQAYGTWDNQDLGLHFLGGQAWSLLTMFKTGLVPRQENIPLTIDAQYVVGFNWTRNPQVRFAKSFAGDRFWLGASLESPQTLYAPTGPNGLLPQSNLTVNNVNPGGSLFNAANNYSTDIAPDVIVKAAADPGWGHYEAYGIGRVFRDRVSTLGSGTNGTAAAGGGGAYALLPLVPKKLELQASFLAGTGIGRYGSAQLPDAIVGPGGGPRPIPEVEALVGVVGHPTPALDLYLYAGTEQESRTFFNAAGKGFGYGSPLYSNATCGIELGAASGCVGNTSGVWQITLGTWWRFIQGPWGTMQAGAQYSYTHRSIFSGIGPTPSTDINMAFLSFRYYPFQ